MARDWDAECGPRITPLLAPGETLRCVVPVSLTLGADQVADAARAAQWQETKAELQEAVRPKRQRSSAARLLGRVTGGVLGLASGGSPVPGTAPDLPNPNGVALIGFPGCAAVRLRDHLDGGDVARLLAATDRRVLVLDDPLGRFGAARAERAGRPVPPLTLLDAIPADGLRAVARRPVQLSRGRLEITFADSSVLAVDTGAKALADGLVAAVPATAPG